MLLAAVFGAYTLVGHSAAATPGISAVDPPEKEIIWELEEIEGIDLDGDGIIGKPPEESGGVG